MVRVRVVTWNMQANAPPSVEMLRAELLPLNTHHVVVVGTEECENTIAKSLINPSKDKWEGRLREVFGDRYDLICGHALQATHSIAFVHRALVPLISAVKSEAVSTGLGVGATRMGNKGGIGIHFAVNGTSLLFINAHLAHARKGYDRRNEEYHTITAELSRRLVRATPAVGSTVPAEPPSSDSESLVAWMQEHVDCLVWGGDLNYRLELERAEAEEQLQDGADVIGLQSLLEHDQLKRAIREEAAFVGMEEAPIEFRPTYKYDHNTDAFDSSAKQRVPSWTDRILFKPGDAVDVHAYRSVQALRTSDHRPVYADFLMGKLGRAAQSATSSRDLLPPTTTSISPPRLQTSAGRLRHRVRVPTTVGPSRARASARRTPRYARSCKGRLLTRVWPRVWRVVGGE
mmetsp:Transcript_31636/g.83586  ORF Transcript_31636/g.83586 Transcript_31636/m.83586 type:complete len:402 (-) Transcript_31636:1636-2841(-)